MYKKTAKKLLKFIQKSPTAFQAVEEMSQRLQKEGFKELKEEKHWDLKAGGNYFVTRNHSAVIAFSIPKKPAWKFHIMASHSDSPALKIKENPEMEVEKAYIKLNVERYGGMLLAPWFDRPLSIAGRLVVSEGSRLVSKLVNVDRDLVMIPNLAIHMNREVNKGVELNKQTELLPICGLSDDADYFLDFLAKELAVKKEDILDFELTIYNKEKPEFVGLNDEFISASRLDNLNSCSALVSAIIDSSRADGMNLIALFDHEEIGSRSKQGAGSILLHDMLVRILTECGLEKEVWNRLYNSMILSVDVAHGLHPNYAGKMDLTNKPVLGKGFCIKEACSQSYATDCGAVAVIQQICEKDQIPYQKFVNRSDLAGGGTLGSIASALLPVKTVDIGIPLLAMHSARELMAAADQQALKDLVSTYFG